MESHPPEPHPMSSSASEIQSCKGVFEIAIQYYDKHEPFFNVEDVKAEKRYQSVMRFYPQKVTEERLPTIYHF